MGRRPWKGAAGRMASAGSGGDRLAEGLWSEPVGVQELPVLWYSRSDGDM